MYEAILKCYWADPLPNIDCNGEWVRLFRVKLLKLMDIYI